MSEIILAGKDERPFSTEKAAKRMRTEKAKEGINTRIIPTAGGFALMAVPPEEDTPAESENALIERREKRRPERIPLHKRNVLTVSDKDKDPNYVYRMVNDKDDRIERFKEAGYEIVNKKTDIGDPQVGEGSQVGTPVSKPVGNGRTGYLMRIKREWYDEDQAAKTAKNKLVEKHLTKQPEKPGQYGKVEIGH